MLVDRTAADLRTAGLDVEAAELAAYMPLPATYDPTFTKKLHYSSSAPGRRRGQP